MLINLTVEYSLLPTVNNPTNQLSMYSYYINIAKSCLQILNINLSYEPTSTYIQDCISYINLVLTRTPAPRVIIPVQELNAVLPVLPTTPTELEQNSYYNTNLIYEVGLYYYNLLSLELLPVLSTPRQLNETILQYVNLLEKQYYVSSSMRNYITSIIAPVVQTSIAGFDLTNMWNIYTASGKQLDLIGVYLGVDRNFNYILNSINYNTLTDYQFKIVLLITSIYNNTSSTIYDLNYLLSIMFGGAITVSTSNNMTMLYQLLGVSDDIKVAFQAITKKNKVPHAQGVGYYTANTPKKPVLSLQPVLTIPTQGRWLNVPPYNTSYHCGFALNYNDSVAGCMLSTSNLS